MIYLKETIAEIDTFSKISGLKLNKKKSLGMWVGSYKNKQYGSEEISWIKNDENIKMLGVFFSTKAEASNIPENWTAKIEDIQLTVQRWSKRNLSLAGKVLIAQTFLLSKLNYIIQALSLPKPISAQIDGIIFKFLWQKKHSNKKVFEKIKRNNNFMQGNFRRRAWCNQHSRSTNRFPDKMVQTWLYGDSRRLCTRQNSEPSL